MNIQEFTIASGVMLILMGLAMFAWFHYRDVMTEIGERRDALDLEEREREARRRPRYLEYPEDQDAYQADE